LTNDIWKYAAVSVGSAAAGAGVTYFITKKRITAKAEARANEEIKSVKERYALLRKEGKYSDPATAIRAYEGREQELHEAVRVAELAAVYSAESDVEEAKQTLQERIRTAQEVEEAVLNDEAPSEFVQPEKFADEVEVRNIFDHEQEPEVEVKAKPDKTRPYLIPEEEYMEDDEVSGYSKLTITYWEEDDTLCDEREAIIPDIEGTVGAINLHSFDESGSKAKDVIYVRNDRLKADYEIVRVKQSYSKVVLGLRDEDRFQPRMRRNRGYDE
jgi:multidrug efflux pump subunit AcrA (membrane-fusion protein)